MINTWKHLERLDQLDQINKDSSTKTVVIFKHSTRCGISLHAMERLENAWDFKESDLDFYYLDLLNYRELSNAIAQEYAVVHQSPQMIIIRKGCAIFNTSHQAISVDFIKQRIN